MLCKKCGAEISDISKFCGYCGEAVLTETISNVKQVGSEQNIANVVEQEQIIQPINLEDSVVESTNEVDLGETIKIEPIQLEEQVTQSENNSAVVENTTNNNIEEHTVTQTDTVEQGVSEQQSAIPSKKNNKLVFIIGGIVLAIATVVIFLFVFLNFNNNTVSVLKKALVNLEEKGKNSATVDAKLSIGASSGETLTLSATAKMKMKNDDEMNMQVTLNESLFFEEMSFYGVFTEEEITMYLESTTIDMLGMTSSLTPTWVYYTMALDEFVSEDATDESLEEIDLEDLIDKNHFVFVNKINEMNHYELIIDQNLIDTMKTKLANVQNQELKDTLDSMEPLENAIKIGFYINNSNELCKIELDMTEQLEDFIEMSSFIISMEFRDLNNTKVEIPSDAKNTVTDLNTYMIQNPIIQDNVYNNGLQSDNITEFGEVNNQLDNNNSLQGMGI